VNGRGPEGTAWSEWARLVKRSVSLANLQAFASLADRPE
jgi:hypothetical protein